MVHRPDGNAVSYSGNAVIEDEELLAGFSLALAEIFGELKHRRRGWPVDTIMVRLAGFEPTASASAGQRSIH